MASISCGDIARFVVGYNDHLYRTFTLFFRADGTGFCRESWNRDDLAFEHEVTMHEWMEGGDELLAARTEEIGHKWLHRQLSALENHQYRDLEWLCGSLEELNKLARWICHLEAQVWREGQILALSINSENEFGRACVGGWQLSGWKQSWWSVEVDALSDELKASDQDSPQPTQRFLHLFDLALDENTPTGLGWEYMDQFAGRCANSPESETLEIEVRHPTAHEIAEAQLNLRAWLRGKMPAAEIELLLTNDAPADLPVQEW